MEFSRGRPKASVFPVPVCACPIYLSLKDQRDSLCLNGGDGFITYILNGSAQFFRDCQSIKLLCLHNFLSNIWFYCGSVYA